MAQEGMFWEFVLKDVVGVPAKLTSAWYECEWRVHKDKKRGQSLNVSYAMTVMDKI